MLRVLVRIHIHVNLLGSCILTLLVVSYTAWLIFKPEVARFEIAIVADSVVYLPYPLKITNMSVEEAILLRRSIREYTSDPVKIEHLAMILWAAYGVTDPKWGFRASPSAGATYPLEVYVVVGEKSVLVRDSEYLKAGVYKYDVHRHLLTLIKTGDLRRELADAALGQEWVEKAPISLVVCAVFERTVSRYGERGRVRYVPMEVGHLGQNVYLMATALGYGAVVVGAFYDDRVQAVISAKPEEIPMYIIPIGVPSKPPRTSFEDIWRYIEAKRSG
jgi:SagB-type dehydrogenase family enzyme